MAEDQECYDAYEKLRKYAQEAGFKDELQKQRPNIPNEGDNSDTRRTFIQQQERRAGQLANSPDPKCEEALTAARTAAASNAKVLEQLKDMTVPLANADPEIKQLFIETVNALAAAAT